MIQVPYLCMFQVWCFSISVVIFLSLEPKSVGDFFKHSFKEQSSSWRFSALCRNLSFSLSTSCALKDTRTSGCVSRPLQGSVQYQQPDGFVPNLGIFSWDLFVSFTKNFCSVYSAMNFYEFICSGIFLHKCSQFIILKMYITTEAVL